MNALRGVLTVVVLSLLLFLPVFAVCFRISAAVVQDPDVWWHLRTGDWIRAHGAAPQFDTFSAAKPEAVSPQEGMPWVDYSWAAQLVLSGFRRAFGLRGLVVCTAILFLAIVLAFHFLVRRMQQNLLLSALLTLAVTEGIMPLAMPRPWLFSMLFFLIELNLLLEAGRTARPRLLLLLVPLFCLWANVHIQFIFGLLVLAAAVVEPLLAPWVPLRLDGESSAISPRWLLLVLGLCCGATLLNPYHAGLYATAWQLREQLWNVISESMAMPFDCVANWTVLAAALAGTVAIALRRPVRLLLVLLFPAAIYSSFRAQRDVWLLLIVGLSLVASMSRGLPLVSTRLTFRTRWAVATVLAVLVLGSLLTLDEARLEAQVARIYPAHAVVFLRQGRYDGPLYNTFNWGGYLIDQYREHPVSIDGRTLVHGVARTLHSVKMQFGEEGWQADPELLAARLFILPRKEAIALLLRLDRRYEIVYEDAVAVVFVRK